MYTLTKFTCAQQVTVTRGGQQQEISGFDLLVGDVLQFGYGDILPVDGFLIQGNNVRCASNDPLSGLS